MKIANFFRELVIETGPSCHKYYEPSSTGNPPIRGKKGGGEVLGLKISYFFLLLIK